MKFSNQDTTPVRTVRRVKTAGMILAAVVASAWWGVEPTRSVAAAPAAPTVSLPPTTAPSSNAPQGPSASAIPELPATRPSTTSATDQGAQGIPEGKPTEWPIAPAANANGANANNNTVQLDDLVKQGAIHLTVGRSLVVKTAAPYIRVSSTQPDVLGHNELDDRTILLTAKKAGSTQLIVWDQQDHSQVVDMIVEVDLNALSAMLKRTFPGTEIRVTGSNGSIVLNGRVANLQAAQQAVDLCASYGKVLNFLEMAGGQQVVLQVRFAEVSRDATRNLGFNAFASDGRSSFGYNNGPGAGAISGAASNTAGTTAGVAGELFAGGHIGSTALEGFLQALRSNNLLRVLAEPNLIAMSGQEASFLAGGEFPVPVPQAGSTGAATITVEYKQFGVRLNFLPVVLGDGRIRLKVTPEVSDLDYTHSITSSGFVIPSLTKRTVTTTIELNEGQTFAVAGLLNNRMTASSDAVPLLGDLPVLGPLFRSVRYERQETELVVLVTPHLAQAMNPGQVPELPGEHWKFPTENDLFINGYLGGPAPDPRAPSLAAPPKFHGPYGFTPVGQPNDSGR